MLRQFSGSGRLFCSTKFWAYALCMAFSIGTLYVFIGGAPTVATQTYSASTAMVGVYEGLVPAGFIVGSFTVARCAGRWKPFQFILVGRLVTFAGLLVGAGLAALQSIQPMAFFGPCICVGLGNGLTKPSANSRVLSIYPDLSGTAVGLAGATTSVGAGAIAFTAGLMMSGSDARGVLLAAMLTTSLVSLGFAAVIARSERHVVVLGDSK
jgi:MFS transporter, DHA1 family, multidrug resistance protein